MDVSIILILPFSAFVAFATLVFADATGRRRPRLIWPFAFSTLGAVAGSLGLPEPGTAHIWVAMIFVIAMWAAFGTVIGALFGKFV